MSWSANQQKTKGLTRLWKLKPSTKLCSNFYVFDTETAHRKNGYNYWCLKATPANFIFGVIYGFNYTKVIHSVEEFRETLLEPRFKNKKNGGKCGGIFAHNAQYDLNTLYGNIFDLDPEAIFNGKFISCTNGNCTFADSMNIFIGMSVAVMGEMMGIDKQKLGDNKYRSKGVTTKDINYCIRDCQIVWDALFETFEFAGEIKITQASLSMAYYRRFHQPFHIDHNENTKHFWRSYFGGRTEVFKLGKTHASCIDINSSYPFHTRNGIFPNPKTLKCETNISIKKVHKYLEWFEGMLDCTLVHHNTSVGFLPVKTKDGKLIFPNGKFRGCWNFPEIRFALKHGVIKILKIHSVVYGERMEGIFTSLIDSLHDKKIHGQITGNKMAVSMSKYYMNMFYGKFGQRINEETIYIRDMEKQFSLIQEYQSKKLFIKLVPFSGKRNDAMLHIGTRKSKHVPYAIPSFASYITTYGRIQLLEKILSMKNNSVVYCDTDSIFFEINNGIVSEKQLGGWKVEDKIITEIKGLKNYKYIEGKEAEVWRIKGVPLIKYKKDKKGDYILDEKNNKIPFKIKLFDGDKESEFDTVAQVGKNSFEYYNLIKSKEALRRGLQPGVLIKRTKQIKNTYDKRVVFKNGTTKPIIL